MGWIEQNAIAGTSSSGRGTRSVDNSRASITGGLRLLYFTMDHEEVNERRMPFEAPTFRTLVTRLSLPKSYLRDSLNVTSWLEQYYVEATPRMTGDVMTGFSTWSSLFV